ncbi:CASP-like protein 4A3 [Curcuma longa]|uniref:CASP-like protein 4A3 n=1 Tax=Curcuma longa TaxID=136217 RepID=UPI003D9F52A7
MSSPAVPESGSPSLPPPTPRKNPPPADARAANSPPRSPIPPSPPAAPSRAAPPVVTLGATVAKSVAGVDGRAAERRFMAAPQSGRQRPWPVRAALGLRVLALLLCMIAFSVMAADKTEGWAGDSYDRYEEFRYLVGVNVIAFVYSLYQVYERIHRMTAMKSIISRPLRYYFDLTMDQILAYLLMSSSSAAASRNDAWASTFGSDAFTRKAKGSITVSFLAFFVFALSALISAHNLFR